MATQHAALHLISSVPGCQQLTGSLVGEDELGVGKVEESVHCAAQPCLLQSGVAWGTVLSSSLGSQ